MQDKNLPAEKLRDEAIKKIENAIVRAFVATGTNYNEDIIQMLALRTTAHFSPKVQNDRIKVEDIQDSVESTLSQAGYENVAKAYILYRKQHENTQELKMDEELNNEAQKFAKQISESGTISISTKHGFNIFYSDSTKYNINSMSNEWYAENQNYDYEKGEDVNQMEAEILHFVQMMWSSASKVGFGLWFGKKGESVFGVALYDIKKEHGIYKDNVHRDKLIN